MKSYLFILFLFIGFIFSCSKSDDDDFENNFYKINLTTGSWSIGLFDKEGMDTTTNFEGYSFLFSRDGKISVEKGTTIIHGTWDLYFSGNDFSTSVTHLKLNFSNNSKDFQNLNIDWIYLENGPNQIGLTYNYQSFLKFIK